MDKFVQNHLNKKIDCILDKFQKNEKKSFCRESRGSFFERRLEARAMRVQNFFTKSQVRTEKKEE